MALAKRRTVDEAVPDRDEIKARIEAMMPLVHELAPKGERDRKVADEVIEAFRMPKSTAPCNPAAMAAGSAATRR